MFKIKKSRKSDATKIILGIFGAAAASIVIAMAISNKEEIKNFFSEGDEKSDEEEGNVTDEPKQDQDIAQASASNGKTARRKKVTSDGIENHISDN